MSTILAFTIVFFAAACAVAIVLAKACIAAGM
jgi:hypothetical protein